MSETLARNSMLRHLFVGILFGIGGLFINLLRIELHHDIDFLFGSVLPMVAILRHGPLTGVTAAAIASTGAYLQWHQPYTPLVFTVEALFVAAIHQRRRLDLVTADLLFWLFISPLTFWIFQHLILGFPPSLTLLVGIKQGVNGVFNAIVASTLVILWQMFLQRENDLPSFRELIFISISMAVIVPALLILFLDIRRTSREHLDGCRMDLNRTANILHRAVESCISEGGGSIGATEIRELRELLNGSVDSSTVTAQIRDPAGNVIVSSFPDDPSAGYFPFPPDGIVTNAGDGVSQWVPAPQKSPGTAKRWREAFLQREIPLDVARGHLLVVRGTLSRTLAEIERRATTSLGGIALLVVILIIFSRAASYLIYRRIEEFVEVTSRIPGALRNGHEPLFPTPRIRELAPLTEHLRQVSAQIISAHRDLRELNETLEEKVRSRTLELEKSRDHWRRTFDSIPDMVCILDLHHRIIHANRAMIDALGGDDATVIGRECFRAVHGLDSPPESCPHAALLRDGREHVAELYEPRIGKHLLISVSPFFDQQGELTGSIHVARDITERKVWEERLAESEARLQQIIDLTPVSIFIKDPDSRVLLMNRSAEEQWGVAFDDICGKTGEEFFPPAQMAHFLETDRRIFREGLLVDIVEEVYNSAAGRNRTCRTLKKPVYDASGKPLYLIGVSVDITDMKETEDQLRRAKEQAEAATRAKSRFLATMSHEIRTPLNGIIGMSQLLSLTPLDEEQQEYADTIRSSGEHLLQIINDILDFSKIEAEMLRISEAPVSCRRLLDRIVRNQSPAALRKGILLSCEIADEVPDFFMGDEIRIAQVLMNLVSNGIKFTARGGVSITVSRQERDGEVFIDFIVHDTGEGISESFMKHLFEPFTQEDDSVTRQSGGTGLGLAISSRLAHLMGGELTVSSRKGEGSTFRLSIPYRPAESERGTLPEVRVAGGRASVLLVDDDPVGRLIEERLLGLCGCEVTAVGSAQEGLDALKESRFDLVVTDIQMPVMGGEEFLQRYRATTPERERIPFVAMTAHVLEDERRRIIDAGFDGYVPKPVETNRLREVLGRVLERRRE